MRFLQRKAAPGEHCYHSVAEIKSDFVDYWDRPSSLAVSPLVLRHPVQQARWNLKISIPIPLTGHHCSTVLKQD